MNKSSSDTSYFTHDELIEASRFEYLVEDDIGHRGEDLFNQVSVGGSRQMGVDWPSLDVDLALAQESVDNEICGLLHIVQPSLVGGKGDPDAFGADFLLENVLFVEEHDERGLRKVGVVDHLCEKVEALVHSVDTPILEEHLVVLGHGHNKENVVHVVKTVYPLFALGPLAANVKHMEHQVLVLELDLQ